MASNNLGLSTAEDSALCGRTDEWFGTHQLISLLGQWVRLPRNPFLKRSASEMNQATYQPCGHSAEADFELPAKCPLCARYGNADMPTKAKIKERLDKAFRVKPILPEGGLCVYTPKEFVGVPVGRCWSLEIDGWRPERLNIIIRHWIKSKQAKDEAIKMFSLAAQIAGCPAATGKRALHLRLEGFRIKPDADAFDKVVLDALKRAGLITDDNERGLLGRMGFEAVLGKERRTVLLIGEVA